MNKEKKGQPQGNKKKVRQPHDMVFKEAFCNKEAMLDFLAANLPKELLSKIDQKGLRLTNKSFVDPVGRRGESDLVFQTLINNQSGYLYFIIEHVRHEVAQKNVLE